MRIGISAAHWLYPWPLFHPETPFEIAAEFGLDGLEIFPRRGMTAERIRALSQQFKVKVLGIHGAYWYNEDYQDYKLASRRNPSWLTGITTQVLRQVLGGEEQANSLKLANDVSAQYVVYHPNIFRRVVSDKMENEKIMLLCENDGGLTASFWQTVAYVRELEEQNYQNVGFTLDTSHLALEGVDLIAAYEGVAHNLKNVHLSDSKPREDRHLCPGKGSLPLERFLNRLFLDGFTQADDTTLTIELSPTILPDIFREAVEKTLEFVHSCF